MIKDYGKSPEQVEEAADQKLSTDEMQELYSVEGFCAPFVVVVRKSDGVKGSLEFGHSPRVYFNFVKD